MTSTPHPSWPVVVVGAGPAGLAIAITLATSGVECYVVDRHAGPAPHPRATALSLRTMEHLRRWGLERSVVAGGCDVELQMRIVPTLAEAASGTTVDVGFPTRAQSRAVSPTTPACVPQDHLETVLVEHLSSLSAARLDRDTSLVDIRAAGCGYILSLRDERTGSVREVGARYVVGADGARSTVRERLGVAVWSTPSLYDGISFVFRASLWDIVGPHRYGLYAIEHPTAAGILLPAGPDERWVYAHDRIENRPTGSPADRIRAAVGRDLRDVHVDAMQAVSFVGAIAAQFRVGDVFLVGDAAHRVTPRGGTGLNTAFADGIDLGWKLAWVLRGWAPASLLDSHELERRPVAEHQLARSIEPDGSRSGTARALSVDVGGRIRHVWLPGSTDRSTLDLVGTGLTVLHHGRRRATPVATSSFAPPVVEHELDAITAQALGILPGGHLAVRPDGVPLTTPVDDPSIHHEEPGALQCPVPI